VPVDRVLIAARLAGRMFFQAVRVMAGVAASLVFGIAGAQASTGSAPRTALEVGGPVTPAACGSSPLTCT
jgi:hypothetical protein